VGERDAVHAILCDGIACDGFIWKYLWDDLSRVVPVVHAHYRGHGRSAPPADPKNVDIATLAGDVMSVRRSVGDPPVVLLGHSMGCQVALEVTKRFPERVRGLVLLCGSFGKVTKTFRGLPILDMVLPKLIEAVRANELVARALWSRIPPETAFKLAIRAGDIDPERASYADMRPYLEHMTTIDFPMFLRMLSAAGEHSAEDDLPNLRVPTLVVAGERDTFTPPYLAEWMAEAIPGAELLVVKGGTHAAPIEQPALVDRRIEEFLRARVLVA
jgi:pimeloyl-ACP methyl ester carboxylesterase